MKHLLFGLAAIATTFTSGAQSQGDPSSWEVSAVAAGQGVYSVNFHVRLNPGWHIWSLHPGIDSSLIPPSFSFDPATAAVIGEASEQGITTDMQLPGVEGYARFYSNEVLFAQQIKAAPAKTVKGSYTYQLCNDKLCLPPKTVPFSVKLP